MDWNYGELMSAMLIWRQCLVKGVYHSWTEIQRDISLFSRKALYGLRTSGLHWHEHFVNVLRDLGSLPSKADLDVWMQRNGDIYEYIATYIDNPAIAAKNPKKMWISAWTSTRSS
jgi:hypothetical protein